MIAVIATIETTAVSRAALLSAIEELVPKVLAEEGCLDYGPHVDLETSLAGQPPRGNVVTMIEKWESIEALEAHLKTPHMLAFRKATESLRLKLTLQILAPV
jgi:quinol monooxygenase YgiN